MPVKLTWSHKEIRPTLVAGSWTYKSSDHDGDEFNISAMVPSGDIPDSPKAVYFRDGLWPGLDSLKRIALRKCDFAYFDAPRIQTDLGKFPVADGESCLEVWLGVIQHTIAGLAACISDSGYCAVICGTRETPHIHLLLNEIFGASNQIGIVAWAKTYGPRNIPGMKEFSENHDNILVFAKRKERSAPIRHLEPALKGYRNPDLDPRGPWKAEHKGAAKADYTFLVNQPPYDWELLTSPGNQLPPGIWRVSPRSGVIWSPCLTEVGEFKFKVKLIDKAGNTVTKEFRLDVSVDGVAPSPASPPWLFAGDDANPAPLIGDDGRPLKIRSTKVLPGGVVGKPYYACLEGVGGEPWTGVVAPGYKDGKRETSRYWEFSPKRLQDAAASDDVDFKSKRSAVPMPKSHLETGQLYKNNNEMSYWRGGGNIEGEPLPVGWSTASKAQLAELLDQGLISETNLTSKPINLMTRLIALLSKPGGTVIDVGSTAGEMASTAVVTGRRAVYIETPQCRVYREGIIEKRIRAACAGLIDPPEDVLFEDDTKVTQDTRGWVLGPVKPKLSESNSPLILRERKNSAIVDSASNSILINYNNLPCGSDEFLAVVASLEGLIPVSTGDNILGVSLDGHLLALYAGEGFVDNERLSEMLDANSTPLEGRRTVRIYFHRGIENADVVAGFDLQLRRIPFDLILRGASL